MPEIEGGRGIFHPQPGRLRSDGCNHAAINIDAPTYAHEILTTAEPIDAIKATKLAA